MLDRPVSTFALGASPPMVSIHVPTCGASPGHVGRALAQLASLDYPAFEVLVIDYDTADPAMWEPVARDCARLGARFRFFHLGRLPSGQAGALNFARTQMADPARFIAVLGHDAVLPRDWLHRVMPSFDDPSAGAVQSPRIVRRDALDDAGGWAEWCVAPEAALDLALLRGRWHLIPTAAPRDSGLANLGERRTVAAREAYAAVQIARRHWRSLLSPFNRELTPRHRWRVVAGWLPWIADALGLPLLILGLALSTGLFRTPIRFDAPAIPWVMLFAGLLTMQLARLRGLGGGAFVRLALCHTVAKAVWGALLNMGPYPSAAGHAPAWTPRTVRHEFMLLALTWGTVAGVAHAHGSGTFRALFWCAVLLAQSVPYLAAVSAATWTALPARRTRSARPGRAPVARTEAGD